MSKNPFTRLWRGPLFRTEIARAFYLALPLMLGEISSMSMGVIGTMMVGHLGPTALSAAAIAGVVFTMAMLLVWGGIRMIPTPVAEAHELRDGARVRTLVLSGLLLCAFFTVVCNALLWAGIFNFHWLGQSQAVAALAVPYLKIIAYSMPFLILFAVLVNFVDAFEYVRFTMFLSFFGLALDVCLNWVFIFGHWGFPALGVRAVAMNVGITHAVMSVVLLILLWRKGELAYFRAVRTQWAAVWAQTKSFVRYGIPSAMQVMVEYSAFGAGTVMAGWINEREQAAHQIALNLSSFTYVTIMGVSTAGMIRIGQALAYKNRARVWLAGVSTIALALLIISVPTLAFLACPEWLARLYMEDPAVIETASVLLLFAGMFQLADAAQGSTISLLRALNDVRWPSLVSVLSFWVIGLPLGYWLAFHRGWNANGIWMGYLVALILQAGLFLRRFFRLVQNLDFG